MSKILDLDDLIARVPAADVAASMQRLRTPRIRPDLGRHTRANLTTPITIYDLEGRMA